MRLGDLGTVLRRAVDDSRVNGLSMTAQALAYALFLAIPATLIVTLGLFSLVADASTVSSLIDRLQTVIPAEAATLLEDSLTRSAGSTGGGLTMTLVGLALAVWATTSAATTLMNGLTLAFDHRDERTFVRKRLTALAVVACLLFAALLVTGLLVLGPYAQHWVGEATGAESVTAWVWWSAQWPILVAGLLFAFTAVLALGPDADQPWRRVAPGAVVALVGWLVASGGFALYAANFGSYNKSWGTLSAVVVTLVWLWLSGAALLFGAEVNAQVQQLADARERDASPAPAKPRPQE
jgi:membrane protein